MATQHYFNQSHSHQTTYHTITGNIAGQHISIQSASGLFAADKIDTGTRLLLQTYNKCRDSKLPAHILDLGCGYGIVSCWYIQKYGPQYSHSFFLDACDSAPLAVEITKNNLTKFSSPLLTTHVIESDVLNDTYFHDKTYELILTNPPFSAGKQKVQEFLTQSYEHLVDDGELWVVALTQRGAKGYIDFCQQLFGDGNVEVLTLAQGFRIWRTRK